MTRAVLLLRLVPSWLVGLAVWGVLMVAVGQLTTAVGGSLGSGVVESSPPQPESVTANPAATSAVIND